ncbi:MAG: TraR/DksA C4-type zinc finger protein [Caldilineaceae bacterium]
MAQLENLLDHGELQNIRQRLEEQRSHLMTGLESYNNSDSHSRVYNFDRTELANQYSSQDRRIALRTLDQQTLRQIEQALARLEEGSYGLCVKCHRPIHPDRLEVLPYATLCVTCQLEASQKV